MIDRPENIPEAWDDLDGVIPPSVTSDVVGHKAAQKAMAEAYSRGKLHHAWLIAGAAGIGKATLAFRFAEHLLRHRNPETAPTEFTFVDDPVHSQVSKGVHPNLLLLRRPFDPKSKKFKTQITVDEVRRAGGFLHTASGADAWRICIVDPADDLNTNAANALLKMLEEPPARTVFLVLAHSPRGLLPTIRSRCQMLAVRSLGDSDLIKVLKRQPLTADMSEKELADLASHAEGSPRRALLLAQSGVLELFTGFVKLVGQQKSDYSQVHRIAGQLAPIGKAQDFDLFFDLINEHLAQQSRSMASNDQVSLESLSRIADIWDRARESKERAETWNLDRKQVILDLFGDMRAA
jgi:DNA polymerase-3 subunit delta'